MSEWQPIETAPTDGGMDQQYLLWDGSRVHIAAVWWFNDEEQQDAVWFDGDYRINPTHWQPLPTPPSTVVPGVGK